MFASDNACFYEYLPFRVITCTLSKTTHLCLDNQVNCSLQKRGHPLHADHKYPQDIVQYLKDNIPLLRGACAHRSTVKRYMSSHMKLLLANIRHHQLALLHQANTLRG
jgi:hypothetical protein